MRSKKSWKGILVLILVFGIMLIGCETEPDDPTYTIWTNSFNFFSTSDSWFGDLQDGQFKRFELSNSEFEEEKSVNFVNKNGLQNKWTEDQLYSYLIGMGFSSDKAKQQSSWLVSINHGCIGSRTGASLNMILK